MQKPIVINISGGMKGKTTVFNRLKRLTKKDDDIIYHPSISRRALFGYNISYKQLFKDGAPGDFIQRIFLNTYINVVVGHDNKVIVCDKFIMDILSLYQYFQVEFFNTYYTNLSEFFLKNDINVFTVLLRNEKYEDKHLTNILVDMLDDNDLAYMNHQYEFRRSEERLTQEIDKACFSIINEINRLKK